MYFLFLLVICFGISYLSVVLVTPSIIKFGKFHKIFDRPDDRKITLENPPTRIGGFSIALGTLIGFGIFNIFASNFVDLFLKSEDLIIGQEIFLISLLSIFFFLIGFSDDLLNLSPWPRLAMQIIGGSIAYYNGMQIKYLDFSFLPFISFHIHLNATISILLTIIWLVGLTNAFNWIDGLDGLAAGTATICAIGFTLFALSENYIIISSLFITLIGSCIGFLKFNKYPSKIIMGDGGAYFVGFIFASFGILVSNNLNPNYNEYTFSTNIFLPITILAFPLFDMARVIFMRIINGFSPLFPDRRHLHHLILDKGVSHNLTVLIIYIMNILFVIVSIFFFL